jgi:hypothetical protein
LSLVAVVVEILLVASPTGGKLQRTRYGVFDARPSKWRCLKRLDKSARGKDT